MKKKMSAMARMLARTSSAILGGIKIGVKWIPENSGDLGFTSKGVPPVINVAWWEDEFFNGLTEEEADALRFGVGAHELLHQIYTNFDYTIKMANSMSRAEAGIFMTFANTIEDPAIEYMAPLKMGGWLLDSLRFSIRHIYTVSKGIEESKNAFSQLINALIHFGDMGIVKGEFTFPEAYEYFKKVAPIYNKAIECPNSKKRIDYARECMEITRPLWEEEVKNAEFMEELMKKLAELLSKATGMHTEEDEDAEKSAASLESSDISEHRKAISKKIESINEAKENSSDSESSDSSDSTTDSADKESSSKDGESTKSDEEVEYDSSTDNASENETENSGKIKESDKKTSDEEVLSELSMTPKEAAKKALEDLEVKEGTVEKIRSNISSEIKRLEDETRDEKASTEALPDYAIEGKTFNRASCINQRVKPNDYNAELYNNIVSMHKDKIKNLAKRLKSIFEADKEEMARTTSGSYNILRGSVGTSARIFDKRRDKGDAKDLGIFLCVDLSGSMCGSKERIARETSVIFAEALSMLNVPYYVMGFSADKGAQAVHYHFVDWNNKKTDRQTLALMKAGGNNFDGYSIRYATEILKAHNSREKILFVISDGEPACGTYRSYSEGISDTTDAIKESRKSVKTFGIAFGNGCNPNTLQGMYGADFIHCSDINLLTNILTKKLEKMLKKGRD